MNKGDQNCSADRKIQFERKLLNNKRTALENLLAEDQADMKIQRNLSQTWDPKTDKLMFAKLKLLHTGQQLN